MADMAERVEHLEDVVWRGNGRPGIVTRVEIVETRQESLEEKQAKWEKIATKLAISAMLAVLSILGHLVWEAIAPHFH